MELERLSKFDPAYGKRAEFGELARESGRIHNRVASALMRGAENLLRKAADAITRGDLDRAERLIERAAAMPYDAHEEGSPGVDGASMLVYNEVHDSFEACAVGDESWLDVALEVHERLDGLEKRHLASVIHGFVLQESFFDLSRSEQRRIRQAVGEAPLEADLGDGPQLTAEQRRDVIRPLVEAAAALREAYDTPPPR